MREWNSNSEHVNFSLPFTMWASSQPPESVILVRCEFQLLLSLSSDTFWEEEYIVQIREAPEEMASPIPYSNTPVSFTSEVHPQHSLCTRTLNILTKISFLKKKNQVLILSLSQAWFWTHTDADAHCYCCLCYCSDIWSLSICCPRGSISACSKETACASGHSSF